jgi:hypothetical protein
MLAMYSGVGAGKFPPSNAGNQLACAAMSNCQRLPKTSDALEAGRWNLLTRSYVSGKPISRQTSFCHSSTCHCAYLSNKQGIGIIFIVDYFATCFALRAGPILECDHFDIRS